MLSSAVIVSLFIIKLAGGAMPAIVKQTWGQAYLQAALEVDGRKMPQRILAARGAVVERLQDLEGNSDHHAERHEIEAALASLTVIEEEAQRWQ